MILVFFWQGRPRLYIPKLIQEDLLKQIHDDMGHMSIQLLDRKYFWPRLYKEVTNYINSCVICQRVRRTRWVEPPSVTDFEPEIEIKHIPYISTLL